MDSGGWPLFHRGAAEVYGRLARYKDRDPAPELEEVVDALLDSGT